MTSECPYIPLCTSYTPCCRVCQEEPGPHCGKWREFDTALQLKREKADKRAQQAKKLFVLVQMAFTLSGTLFIAISMMMTENVYWQMSCVVLSGLVLWCFIYWVGEWTK